MLFPRRKKDYSAREGQKEDYSNLGYTFDPSSEDNWGYEAIVHLSDEEILKATRMSGEEKAEQQRMFELLESGENIPELEKIARKLGEAGGI